MRKILTPEERVLLQRKYVKAYRKKHQDDPVFREKARAKAKAYYYRHLEYNRNRAVARYHQKFDEIARRRKELRQTPEAQERIHLANLARAKRERQRSLQKKYGIDLDTYDRLLARQSGVCAICLRSETTRNRWGGMNKYLRVDHDHTNGQVRGLLCTDCNQSLGKFADSTERLERAIHYLQGTLFA